MEELRSTEILDREIEEDARKKAQDVFADAETEAENIIASVDSRIETVAAEEKTRFNEKIDRFRRDLEASLPLEKGRFLVSFEQSTVMSAIDAYLVELPQKQRLAIIAQMLQRFQSMAVFGTERVIVRAFGISAAEAKRLVSAKLSVSVVDCVEVPFEQTGLKALSGITIREGIIIETEDLSIRARATIDEALLEILDGHNGELTKTLFGGRLPS
jgi:V/A-type H+-transporting ATPase subunit E